MYKRTASLTALALLLSFLKGGSKINGEHHQACNYFPGSDKTLPVDSPDANGFTEKDFNDLIDSVEKVYQPIFSEQGLNLKIVRDWTSGVVNAYADMDSKDGTRIVKLLGGMFRYPGLDLDAYTIVICHEFGHHLGGAPKVADWSENAWASYEGQSDYFATLKCTRELWKNDNNRAIVKAQWIDPTFHQACAKVYSDPDEKALCIRSMFATEKLWRTIYNARSLGSTVFQDALRRAPQMDDLFKYVPAIDTPALHPNPTCRMETGMSGALCAEGPRLPLNSPDIRLSGCSVTGGKLVGARPPCWFGIMDRLKSERPTRDQAIKAATDLLRSFRK